MKAVLLCLIFILAKNVTFAEETKKLSDEALWKFALEKTNAVRITQTPVRVSDRLAMLCAPAFPEPYTKKKDRLSGEPLVNPHREKFVHVYVSPDGVSAMKTNTAVFPRGTIILKEKFADSAGKETELFTGMVKREAGYNPDCGDWEFFTLNGAASKVTSRGKLQKCIDCHIEYRNRDFVTKNYVTLGAGK